jgi:hypothetical protein
MLIKTSISLGLHFSYNFLELKLKIQNSEFSALRVGAQIVETNSWVY